MQVDYQERFSAAGRIPRNSQRRELGPTGREIATAQSVQCALEPLFARGFAARCQACSSHHESHHCSASVALSTYKHFPACTSGWLIYCGSGRPYASMMQDSSCMQVSSTLISTDGHTDPEPLAINAASAAFHTSDIPWMGMPSPAADKAYQDPNVHRWDGHV